MRIKENQNVLDATIQTLGTLEGLFDFCLENDFSLNDDLPVNTAFVVPETNNTIPIIADYFGDRKIELATNHPQIDELPTGIGFMRIESTFIIT